MVRSRLRNTICNDEPDMVTEAVNDWIKKGAQMVVCTGGMSVDPDDKTPLAIRNASDEVITYGAPVLPGAMFMLAYKGEIPIMGLPGCVMYEGVQSSIWYCQDWWQENGCRIRIFTDSEKEDCVCPARCVRFQIAGSGKGNEKGA